VKATNLLTYAYVFVALACSQWIAAGLFGAYLRAYCPTRPDAAHAFIYALREHSAVVYTTFAQHVVFYGLMASGVLAFLLAGLFKMASDKAKLIV
jgi:hypothetical protein